MDLENLDLEKEQEELGQDPRDQGGSLGEALQPKYARIRRTLWKYGPGKDPAKDPPDEVLERVEWRELSTNRLLTPEEAELKEMELRAKGGYPDASD
jgi:hypothetical protein